MNRRTLIIFALTALVASVPAQSLDKTRYRPFQTAPGGVLLIDDSSIESRGKIHSFWVLYKKEEGLSLYILTALNCTRKKDRMLRSVAYDAEGRKLSENTEPTAWLSVGRDSLSRELLKEICN